MLCGSRREPHETSSGSIACWRRRPWHRFEQHRGAIDVPEIAARFGKFDGDLPSAAGFRIDKHNAAFALFFGETVDDEDLLAEFYAGPHLEQPAVQADGLGGGYISEGTVSEGMSVNFDGN